MRAMDHSAIAEKTASARWPYAGCFPLPPMTGRVTGQVGPLQLWAWKRAIWQGTFTLTEFRPKNPNPFPTLVRRQVWLVIPNIGNLNLIDVGADGVFSLPGNLDQNGGPISLFSINPLFPPKGSWQFNSRLTDPMTGVVLSEDINPFEIR